jgi:acetyl-CoA C-acetyltransferase
MESVVVVSGARTPIGSFGGALSSVEAHELGAVAVRAALDRAGADLPVDEVVLGCIGQVGPDAYNARRVALAAGLPVSTPAFNVNRLCGSGLQALLTGAMQLQTGHGDVVVAGGDESMSQQPFLVPAARDGWRLGDRQLVDGTLSMVTDPWGGYPMGATAEKVAQRFGVSREEQDAWALLSQQRTKAAVDGRAFVAETVPVTVRSRRGDTVVDADEHPRPSTTAEDLAALRPAFASDGTVTAGNSSGINDGAAAVVLMRESDARARGLAVLGRLVGWQSAALEPEIMGYAPTTAIARLLDRLGLAASDLDVVELNEAFAAQVVAVIRDAGLDPERTNPNGGGIALGHPVGATGAILVVKLLHDLHRRDLERGMVTMCIGGGQALAAVFERC